jgi:hypothetical protein
MSYNGSGTFLVNSAGQPVVTGTVISSTAFNALTADLATGLSTAITKDGQTTTTVRVPFAQGISSTLVTDATSATTGSIITAGGISCQKALYVGTTANIAGAVTLGSTLTYSDGLTPDGELILAQSFSSASAVVFNSVPTKFKRFRLQINDLIFSTGASLRMQLSQSGVFKSAGYAWGLTIITTTAGANANVNNSSDSAFQVTGGAVGAGTNPVVVTVEIGNLASSSLNKTISFNGTYPPSSGGGSAGIFGGGTYLNDTNACDGIQIYGSAGTITGTASLRGYL